MFRYLNKKIGSVSIEGLFIINNTEGFISNEPVVILDNWVKRGFLIRKEIENKINHNAISLEPIVKTRKQLNIPKSEDGVNEKAIIESIKDKEQYEEDEELVEESVEESVEEDNEEISNRKKKKKKRERR